MGTNRALLVVLLGVTLLPSLSLAAAKNPTITGITHSSTGSLIYTISGTGFQKGAKLLIGGLKPVSLWQGGTQFLVFQPPLNKTGTVDVQVNNTDGTRVLKKGGFTYPIAVAVKPVIRGVAPNEGSTVLKTVWGSNFDSGAKVYVNGTLAPAQWQVGTQYIVFQPPAGTNGTVTIEVRNQSGGRTSKSVDLAVTDSPGGGSYAYETPYAYQTPSTNGGGTVTGGAWAYMGGEANPTFGGAMQYGTKGTPAAGNIPGLRSYAVSWIGPDRNLWLFGGYGASTGGFGVLDDVWKYDLSKSQWAWMYGSNTGNVAPSYATKGSPGGTPGGRKNPASWGDGNGNLWIFGGVGAGDNEFDSHNDLWKLDASTGQWTWKSGSQGISASAGAVCTGSTQNPGSRVLPTSITDRTGNLWLFGGRGYNCDGTGTLLNDLWKYSPGTNQWILLKGPTDSGNTTSQGTASPSNIPAGRQEAAGWADNAGNIWIFGGANNTQSYDDLWEYKPSLGVWILQGGGAPDTPGSYGTKGVEAGGNMPGARRPSTQTAVDSSGNFWLFGGIAPSSPAGRYSDLWTYNPGSNKWTWVAGPNSLNAGPTSGAIGAASPSYNPGIRNAGAAWADSSGRIWILGGEVTYSGVLSDLWVFNPTTTGGGTYPTPYAYPTPSGGGGVAKIIFRFPVRDDQWDQFDNYAPRGSLIFPQYNPNGHSELVTDLTITPGLAAHIRKTHDAGMKVLGYVGAKFNTGVVKDDATTKAEINKWYELYGMDGIYFGAGGPLDQASIDHFKRMATYIHDKGGIVVMHGDEEGGFTDQQFVTAFDVLVTNEQYVHYDDSGRLIGEFHKIGSFDDSYTFHDSVHTWMSQYPRSKFAAFANFNAVSLDVLKKAEKEFLDFGNGYIYLSNLEYDNEKNPEDLTFWRTEIDGLDGSFDGNLPR